MSSQSSILLESGTNEVEILEFVLGGQSFGVNVLKIQAIEQYDPARVTAIQLAHPSVVGTLLFRESCITLINLGTELDTGGAVDADGQLSDKLVLVMEFNQLKSAFLVDGVDRIHRVSWEAISPLSPYLGTSASKFTGSLAIEGREILLVDMEKIITEILPRGQFVHSVSGQDDAGEHAERAGKLVFLAEDSAVIRDRVRDELARGGYARVEVFANGRLCHDAVVRRIEAARAGGGDPRDELAAVITDIEMPAMDGLALCRSLKENLQLNELPVIIFSSLINEQIAAKCEAVGADAYISKPQFTKLVDLLDQHCGLAATTVA